MESLVPAVLFTYLTLFKPHFTKSGFVYFSGYILGLLITGGRKRMNHVAQTCFWVDRHLSSWERFLAEYRWDPTALLGTLLETLKTKLGQELMVHGACLAVVDTLLMAKNGRKMPGVQTWKDHSGNADRGEPIRGHHWALVGLVAFSPLWGHYRCLPLLMQLISGQFNPYMFMVDPNGVATLATFWDRVLPLIVQLHLLLNQAPLRVVADACFGKASFIQPLLTAGIQVVTRLRHDAVGWDDPSSDQRSDARRGKKWKLAQLLDHLPAELVTVHLYGKLVTVKAVCREVWLRDISQKVKMVVVEGLKEPILLVSTEQGNSGCQGLSLRRRAQGTDSSRFHRPELDHGPDHRDLWRPVYDRNRHTRFERVLWVGCLSMLPAYGDSSLCPPGLSGLCLYRLIQLKEETGDWLPPVPKGVSPASFAHLRQGLRRFILGRILSPQFGELPKSQDSLGELEAVLRIVG